MLYFEILFVLLLTIVNGALAMSELAVVSSRRGRLEHMAKAGDRGAAAALRLVDDPGRFLSTVQIGITLIGILAGAISGATVADRLGDWFDTFPVIAPNGDAVAIGLVVVGITYLSLIVGELVPKRIAMTNPERVAARIAKPMQLLSRVAAPLVWVLKISTEFVLRLLRLDEQKETTVTEEEVKSLIAEGTRAGVFVPEEREMIEGVLRLADRAVRAIMTPRTEIYWLDPQDDPETVVKELEDSHFSRLLVCAGSVDNAIGLVRTKDILPKALRKEPIQIAEVMVPVSRVHEATPVMELLDIFRRQKVHMAVVVDERGTTQGVVTPTDILEAIAGRLPERGEETGAPLMRRKDGTWLVDGTMPIDEFEHHMGLHGLSGGDFTTVAGFALHQFKKLPTVGAWFDFQDVRYEVMDMDGQRIDKLLVRLPEEG